MTASEKGRVLKLDVAAAIVVHYSQNPQISPRVVFLSRSKFFEPKLKPKKKDFSRRYIDISFIRLPIEWARHWFSTFPTPNNIVPSIILSRMIGERFRSCVAKREKSRGKKTSEAHSRRANVENIRQVFNRPPYYAGISARFVSPFSNFHKSGSKRELSWS